MRYFTENKDDIAGYMKNLETLEGIVDQKTYHFMLNHSFHDSYLHQLSVFNKEGKYGSKTSPVSVLIRLTASDEKVYELLWDNVSVYSTDFDISRNKIVETNDILFERGLDQWSHDELRLTEKGDLHHEIILFSQTKIIIQCKQFFITHLPSS